MTINEHIHWVFIIMMALMTFAVNAEESKAPLSNAEITAVIEDDDVINLDGVQIRGNKELPQVLYIVPWQEVETSHRVQEQDIILHSLLERRVEPMMPEMDDSDSEPR